MILYAKTHEEGAKELVEKYRLEPVRVSAFIHQRELLKYFQDTEDAAENLFNHISQHENLHAYCLEDLELHFHPQPVTMMLGQAYKKFYSQII